MFDARLTYQINFKLSGYFHRTLKNLYTNFLCLSSTRRAKALCLKGLESHTFDFGPSTAAAHGKVDTSPEGML